MKIFPLIDLGYKWFWKIWLMGCFADRANGSSGWAHPIVYSRIQNLESMIWNVLKSIAIFVWSYPGMIFSSRESEIINKKLAILQKINWVITYTYISRV